MTRKLKRIVARYGWPTITLVGLQASQAAGLILVHSPDLQFKKRMLPILQRLVEEDKIVGSDAAGLADRILVKEGKPQRFGTQMAFRDGKMVIEPVEDPDHLEERRAKYLLPPMSVYKKMLVDMYHMPIE